MTILPAPVRGARLARKRLATRASHASGPMTQPGDAHPERRGWDSNPRRQFDPPTRFPVVHLQPLGHLSRRPQRAPVAYRPSSRTRARPSRGGARARGGACARPARAAGRGRGRSRARACPGRGRSVGMVVAGDGVAEVVAVCVELASAVRGRRPASSSTPWNSVRQARRSRPPPAGRTRSPRRRSSGSPASSSLRADDLLPLGSHIASRPVRDVAQAVRSTSAGHRR